MALASAALCGVACIAVGPAGVASADPELKGTYTATWDLSQAQELKDPKVETERWVITPCGAGCADVKPDNGAAGQLRLVDGRWEMSRTMSLVNCRPPAPDQTTTTSIDAETLEGTQSTEVHCVGMSYGGPISLKPA